MTADDIKARMRVVGDCWLPPVKLGNTDGGYQLRLDGKARLAHRVAWELDRGPIPRDYVLVRTCESQHCGNPEHRQCVPKARAPKVMQKMGRMSAGALHAVAVRWTRESHPQRKLDAERAARIRELVLVAGVTRTEAARQHGVSATTVGKIVAGEAWREATPWTI